MSKNTAKAYTSWQDSEERDRILLEQLPQVRYLARRIHERLPRHVQPPRAWLVHLADRGHGQQRGEGRDWEVDDEDRRPPEFADQEPSDDRPEDER